jgi:hypothetical protein
VGERIRKKNYEIIQSFIRANHRGHEFGAGVKRRWQRTVQEAVKAKSWVVNYQKTEHHEVLIYDGIGRKQRKIIVPTFRELTVQHAVVNVLKPIFMKGMYEHSYASIPGRGVHKAKKQIEKWIKHDTRNVKYVLKMDIKHFFDSVPHDILKAKLEKLIHDSKLLDLLFKIIDTTEHGLPLGFYTSQWFANWYLQDLDHFIKEDLKAVHYVRYMDDMVIFGSNKKTLHEMRKAIEKYLNDKLGLTLKENWQVFRFHYVRCNQSRGRDLDFMGFRFYRNRTTLRRRIMLKATRKAKKISKKSRATIYDIRQMLSYLGWLDCTDTYDMYQKTDKTVCGLRRVQTEIIKI